MKNQVIAGDYKNWEVIPSGNKIYFMRGLKKTLVDRTTVAKYELISDVQNNSFWKPLLAGGVGGMVFGPLGMIAGVASTAKKQTLLVSIEFNDGKKSLVEVDQNGYKKIMTACF